MSFGEQLQAVRRKSGLTQEEFAAQLKVSRQAVSKWESSRGYPEIEKIIYICNRYGTTMDELFAEEVAVGDFLIGEQCRQREGHGDRLAVQCDFFLHSSGLRGEKLKVKSESRAAYRNQVMAAMGRRGG